MINFIKFEDMGTLLLISIKILVTSNFISNLQKIDSLSVEEFIDLDPWSNQKKALANGSSRISLMSTMSLLKYFRI